MIILRLLLLLTNLHLKLLSTQGTGAENYLALKELSQVTLLPECQSEIIQLHPDLHPVISLLKNDDGRRASYLSGSSKCA